MSDGNSQLLPSRRHARVLPETIGTAVTLNVVKRLERVSPHLRNTLPATSHSREHQTWLRCLCPLLPALNLIEHTYR
jgi:hypothetical protein